MPSPTNKAQDNSIRENVYRVIRENITSLQLAPGTTVSTQELAAKLQVSRTPVREAFIRLQKEDLVEITPQKGTMVSRIDLTRAEKERFIRESLETAILPLFLQNCTEPDLKELELLIEKQKACFTGLKPLEFIALDNQFHQRFFELAGQDLSWDVVASTNPHYNRLRVLTVQNAATFDGAVRQHEVMMDQIRRRWQARRTRRLPRICCSACAWRSLTARKLRKNTRQTRTAWRLTAIFWVAWTSL